MTVALDGARAGGRGLSLASFGSPPWLTPREDTWGAAFLAVLFVSDQAPAQDRLAAGAEVETLFADLLRISLSPRGFSRTYGGRSITSADPRGLWARKNQRRLHLIDRKYTTGLSPAEESELAELQADVAGHMRAVAPLPFDALRRLEELTETAGPDQDTAK